MKTLGEINVNHDLKLVWIAPERTGSRTQANILSYCGFINDGNPVCFNNTYRYTHNTNESLIPKGYEIICGARNPYDRIQSIYSNLFGSKQRVDFDGFLFQWVPNGHCLNMVQNPKFLSLKPKYVLRMENLFDDFRSLPFIFDFLTEKQLKMLLIHEREREPSKSLSDKSKLKIQELCGKHFDIWGYKR